MTNKILSSEQEIKQALKLVSDSCKTKNEISYFLSKLADFSYQQYGRGLLIFDTTEFLNRLINSQILFSSLEEVFSSLDEFSISEEVFSSLDEFASFISYHPLNLCVKQKTEPKIIEAIEQYNPQDNYVLSLLYKHKKLGEFVSFINASLVSN
ncbi:MAG: hypothetical protein QNJ54_33095 [Prochloraceae cyanobacterium]|nr:hypothetical protein [Prochloraceae cyanobacterium]